MFTTRLEARDGRCVYAEESGGGEVEDRPISVVGYLPLQHRIRLHPRRITGLPGKVSRGRRWRGRRGIGGGGSDVVVPSRLRMEQSCNVFCHGGCSSTRTKILLILLLLLSHQATTLDQERRIKLLILTLSYFDQLTYMFCKWCTSEEINGMCNLRRRCVLMGGSGVLMWNHENHCSSCTSPLGPKHTTPRGQTTKKRAPGSLRECKL